MSDQSNTEPTTDPPVLFSPQLLEVDTPANGKKSYPVKVDGDDACICAYGKCTEESYSEYASDVYVSISGEPPSGQTPPPGATKAILNDGDWAVYDLCGAYYYYYGAGADNYLGVWAYFPSTGWKHTVSHFKGLYSTHTFCESLPPKQAETMTNNFGDVLQKLELTFPKGMRDEQQGDFAKALAKALTNYPKLGSEKRSEQEKPVSSGSIEILGLFMESQFFHSPDHRVELKGVGALDGQTSALYAKDDGTGAALELFCRIYHLAMGGSDQPPTFRLTGLMSSPLFPTLTLMNWTVHLTNNLAEDKGVFRDPATHVKFEKSPDCEEIKEAYAELCAANDNNTFGPSPIPMRFVIRYKIIIS